MLKNLKYLILLIGLARSAYFDNQNHKISNQSIGMLLSIRGIFLILEMLMSSNHWREPLTQTARGFLVLGSLMLGVYYLTGKSIGGGDVKLLAVMGAFCGYEQTLWMTFFAAIFAVVPSVFGKKRTEIPFAPYIFMGTTAFIVLQWLKNEK